MPVRKALILLALAAILTTNSPAFTPKPAASLGPSASYLPLVLNSALPASSPFHRIGVRLVAGAAQFYDRKTYQAFTPRGNNYIRIGTAPCLDPGLVYHTTFVEGLYDPAQAEDALEAMQASGYNLVRVFFTPACMVDAQGVLSQAYLTNLADFLQKAADHRIYTLLATDDAPFPGYMEHVPYDAQIEWPNRAFMTQEGIQYEGLFWQDVIRALIDLDAPLEAIFGYSLRNEAFFLDGVPPLSLDAGLVTTGNGETYDLSDPAARQAMMDDNLVYWLDGVRAAILVVDPTALVGIGFFVPQGPNPARPGDPRLIRTYPAIWDSQADFVDLHPYPGTGLTLDQYVENFETNAIASRAILMGEFGAFTFSYGSAAVAAQALQDWQVASCPFGFDGWLLWTWDTDEQTELWNGMSSGGVIQRALAPLNRPDACQPGPYEGQDLALGRPVSASAWLPDRPPGLAVDGDFENWWGSGAMPPPAQWIAIDLGAPYVIAEVRLAISQSPSGVTLHRLWGRGNSGDYRLLAEFNGYTQDEQVLDYRPSEALDGIQFIKVETLASPSWVSWREIEVLSGK
jgi:hypothetical protein